MKKLLLFVIILFSVVIHGSDAKAKEGKAKSNAFDKIDKRDKNFFLLNKKELILQ